MLNKYEYEKITSTLETEDFSRENFTQLFNDETNGFCFVNDTHSPAYSIDKIRKNFVDSHTLITLDDYEATSHSLFSATEYGQFLNVLTYNFSQYISYIKNLLDDSHSSYSDTKKNHCKNFMSCSFLNRINYYLLFITSKLKTIDSHLTTFFNGKTFSLNSCPTYPNTIQQTLMLSQLDSKAVLTAERMTQFLKNVVIEVFLGTIGSSSSNFDTITDEDFSASNRKYYDKTYTINTGDMPTDNFVKYVIPSHIKDNIASDFYLQLQLSDSQPSKSIFKEQSFDNVLHDWKYDGSQSIYEFETITLFDVLFFLSIFIEKLSHIKQFTIKWKHLKDEIITRFHALTTVTINYDEDDESDDEAMVNHASYITAVISPLQKRIKTLDSGENENFTTHQTNTNTNVLLINNIDNNLENNDNMTNLFESIIFDNEIDENIGNIENTIPADIGHYFNTNGIFGAQYFISRKNNFKLTLEDVQKQFNLYKGQVISRKNLLKAIDYIFNMWTLTMSTYTLQIITCHSNCHTNFGIVSSKIDGNLHVTKTKSANACLARQPCGCGTVLSNRMKIYKEIDPKFTANYDITSCVWTGNVVVSVASGSDNYRSKPSKLKVTLTIGSHSETKYCTDPGASPVYTFKFVSNGGTIPDAIAAEPEIIIDIADMDSACGVSAKEYNNSWVYQKTYNMSCKFTIEGTLKSTYTITWDANGGTAMQATSIIKRGDPIGSLPTAIKASYTFSGWYTVANGGTLITAETIPTANTTYYAHWTPS